MNTRQGGSLALLVLVVLQTSGCMMDRQVRRDINPDLEIRPKAKEYSPGFTGHTSGYGGYGGYLNGYGPSFWNPRYYYYTGYGQGYSTGF